MDASIASQAHAQGHHNWRPVTLECTIFGLRLRVRTFSQVAASAISQALECKAGGAAHCELALTLDVGPSAAHRGVKQPEIAVRDTQIVLKGESAYGHADAVARTASCHIAHEFLFFPMLLRERVLDPLILFIITRNGRAPVHAAGFIVEGLAVLLAGPSGAGKSCLALAADRAGHRVLSDDTIYMQHDPTLKVWGRPTAAHLLPHDAIGLVSARQRSRGGKLKEVVPFRTKTTNELCGSQAALCILARGEAPRLRRLDRKEALSRLRRLETGFDLIAGVVDRAHIALCRDGAWELSLSRDSSDAITCIERALPILRRTAVP
jgi:hypothetical protein